MLRGNTNVGSGALGHSAILLGPGCPAAGEGGGTCGRVCGLEGCLLGKARAWSCSGQIAGIEGKGQSPQNIKRQHWEKKVKLCSSVVNN